MRWGWRGLNGFEWPDPPFPHACVGARRAGRAYMRSLQPGWAGPSRPGLDPRPLRALPRGRTDRPVDQTPHSGPFPSVPFPPDSPDLILPQRASSPGIASSGPVFLSASYPPSYPRSHALSPSCISLLEPSHSLPPSFTQPARCRCSLPISPLFFIMQSSLTKSSFFIFPNLLPNLRAPLVAPSKVPCSPNHFDFPSSPPFHLSPSLPLPSHSYSLPPPLSHVRAPGPGADAVRHAQDHAGPAAARRDRARAGKRARTHTQTHKHGALNTYARCRTHTHGRCGRAWRGWRTDSTPHRPEPTAAKAAGAGRWTRCGRGPGAGRRGSGLVMGGMRWAGGREGGSEIERGRGGVRKRTCPSPYRGARDARRWRHRSGKWCVPQVLECCCGVRGQMGERWRVCV